MTTTQPVVLHVDTIVCDGQCGAEFDVVSDGVRAYAHTEGTDTTLFGASTHTPGTIVAQCPSIEWPSEYRCSGEIVVDLSSDHWTPATKETLDLLAFGGVIER